MEDQKPQPLPRERESAFTRRASGNPMTYAILASFLLGSFAGAAFGVVFALSLNGAHYPWPEPAAAEVQIRRVSAEDTQVIQAARKVSPSVVSIVVSKEVSNFYNQTGPMFFDFFGNGFELPQGAPNAPKKTQIAGGTGFVMSSNGLIVTNRHVLADADASAEVEVFMADGKSYPALVLARDPILDIAVLKVEAADLQAVDLGDSDSLQIGETVIAIGNALSEYQNTVTKGVISGINRRVVAGDGRGDSEVLEEALQTDAAINPGNSGGPLINLRGQVIGVNTAVNRSGQSIGFAIPINAAKVVIESIKANGRIVRPWLGVRYALLTPEIAKANGFEVESGALVVGGGGGNEAAVVPDSPAAKAGIEKDDILLEVDGAKIDETHPLSGLIARHRAGDTISIALLRKGVHKTVQVILGELPEKLP